MVKKQGNPPIEHTVEKDDNLFEIAKAYYGDGNQWQKIAHANRDEKGNDLKAESLVPGQKIHIPQ